MRLRSASRHERAGDNVFLRDGPIDRSQHDPTDEVHPVHGASDSAFSVLYLFHFWSCSKDPTLEASARSLVQARTVPYLQVSSSSSFWDRWDGCSLGTFR